MMSDRLSRSLLTVRPPETRAMVTAEGVRLDADVWRPEGQGEYPVLLMRQIYGRRIGCTICYAHPSWYAAHGYVVVVQDSRGRGSSEGRFRFGEHDAVDGVAAIDWAASLEGTTGAVGMYGFSYQGYNQLMAAPEAGPALKALAPAMCAWDVRRHWAYENGAFHFGGNLGWAVQIAAETARHGGDAAAFAELRAASRALPLGEAIACRPELMRRHTDLGHYQAWLDTPAESAYWQAVSPAARTAAIAAKRLPILLVGGWYDTFLRGTLAAYKALAAEATAPVRLVIGPWIHFPWDRRSAGRDFGPAAARSMDALHIRWFDHWLKGIDTGLLDEPPVELFDLGSGAWRGFEGWPSAGRSFHIGGSGAASIDPTAGTLGDEAAAGGVDYVVHDPWRPAPGSGGQFGTPPGAHDRAATDARGDILTFTTEPFAAPASFAGDVAAVLNVESDAPSFDLCCTLSLVTAGGQVLPLTEGYATLDGAGAMPLEVPMRATCVSVGEGEALRLSVAGASFPAFAVNPGTGESATTTPAVRARIITIGLRHGERSPSLLRIGAGRGG